MDSGGNVLLFFLLGLLYFVSCLFALFRCVVLFRHPQSWKQSRLFYLSILVQALFRTISFIFAMCEVNKNRFDLLYLILNIPDSLFVSAYLILFWQLISVYVLTHVSSAHALARGIPAKRMSLTANLIILTNCLWLATESILYICVLVNAVNSPEKDSEIAIVDLVLPLLVLFICCYLQCRYSGVPYRSRAMRNMLKKCNRVTLIWSILRLLRGAIGLFTQFELKMEMIAALTQSNKPQSIIASFIYIAVLLLSEVLCYFFVLDYGFFGKFLFSEEERSETSANTASPNASQRPLVSLANSTFVNSDNIEEMEELPSRRHALGQIFKGKLNGELVAVRKISFSRMNTYVFEELFDEVEALKQCDFQFVSPLLCACFSAPFIRILMPFSHRGSLFSLLHEKKEKLSRRVKLLIARDVCKGMQELYGADKPHGHLSSRNVMLETEGAKVADVGLHKLKKFASVVAGYINKTAWSSPEQLNSRSKCATKVRESDDIYSFGVILWELVAEEQPFPNVAVERLKEMVVVQQLRPEIPQKTEEELSQLIRSCWNREPAHRPNFNSALESVNRLLDA